MAYLCLQSAAVDDDDDGTVFRSLWQIEVELSTLAVFWRVGDVSLGHRYKIRQSGLVSSLIERSYLNLAQGSIIDTYLIE